MDTDVVNALNSLAVSVKNEAISAHFFVFTLTFAVLMVFVAFYYFYSLYKKSMFLRDVPYVSKHDYRKIKPFAVSVYQKK